MLNVHPNKNSNAHLDHAQSLHDTVNTVKDQFRWKVPWFDRVSRAAVGSSRCQLVSALSETPLERPKHLDGLPNVVHPLL